MMRKLEAAGPLPGLILCPSRLKSLFTIPCLLLPLSGPSARPA